MPEPRNLEQTPPQEAPKRGLSLKDPLTRRQLLKAAGLGVGVTVAGGAPVVLGLAQRYEQAKKEALEVQVDAAKSGEDLERSLKDLTQEFIRDYDYRVEIGNPKANVWEGMPEEERGRREVLRKQERESVAHLMERGRALYDLWVRFEGTGRAYFDSDQRLHLGERVFDVNENERDFHLALNLMRTHFAVKAAEDPMEKDLAQEDYNDFVKLVDSDLQIEIAPNSWLIMPKEWALGLARVNILFKSANTPRPQKIVIDPEIPSDVNVGGYYRGAEGIFPEQGMALFLRPNLSPGVIFHETGHYLEDIVNIPETRIGVREEAEYPNHRLGFGKAAAEAQRKAILESRDFGRMDELNAFVSSYAATNPSEDFASTLEDYIMYGPVLRQWIEERKREDPRGTSLLEAKYQYIKEHIAGGEEFSFGGRKKRIGILEWEEQRKNSFPERGNPKDEVRDETEWRARELGRIEGFQGVKLTPYVSTGNYNYALALLESSVWEDVLGLNRGQRVESASPLYPIAHLEIEGSFWVGVHTAEGEARVFIDPNYPELIEHFVERVKSREIFAPEIDITPPPYEFSEESHKKFGELEIPIPKFTPWSWGSSYPPNFVDNREIFYVRFTQNEKGQWEKTPIDRRVVDVYVSRYDEKRGRVAEVQRVYPVQLGERDLILAINSEGRIHEIITNGLREVPGAVG